MQLLTTRRLVISLVVGLSTFGFTSTGASASPGTYDSAWAPGVFTSVDCAVGTAYVEVANGDMAGSAVEVTIDGARQPDLVVDASGQLKAWQSVALNQPHRLTIVYHFVPGGTPEEQDQMMTVSCLDGSTTTANGSGFTSVSPARVWDSRTGPGPTGQVGPNQTRDIIVTGTAGVPAIGVTAGAAAVTLNVTVTGTTAPGFLTVWPAGQVMPVASSLNWAAGQTIPNAVTVKVGAAGMVSVFNQTGSTDVIIDVVGYYAANSGNPFAALPPARILDSRAAGPQIGPFGTPWGPGDVREVTVIGAGGVPAGADAVVVNVTVTGTTAPGFLTVWPSGQPQPLASSLNWARGQTIPNAVTAKVGAGGKVSVYNQTGNVDVIIDAVGSFSPGTGNLFHALSPSRILDSRPTGPQVDHNGTPWGPDTTRDVQASGAGGVPAGAAVVVMNVTVTGTTAVSYLTVWPAGQAPPLASSLNWAAGDTIPNSVTAKLSPTGGISIKNAVGEAQVVADVAGWYG